MRPNSKEEVGHRDLLKRERHEAKVNVRGRSSEKEK